MKPFLFRCLKTVAAFFAGKGLGLAKVPGVRRLYDWAYRRFRPSGVLLLTVHGSKMFYDTEIESPLQSLVTLGSYESFETGVFRALLKPGMTVVDIGANIGYYTLLSARAVGDEGLVFAFEPDPRHFALLARSIEANGYKNIVAVQKAISERAGSLVLYADGQNSSNSSLARDNVGCELGSFTVATETLDNFLLREGRGRQIDVIKIDVQGAEGLVLKGAHRTFASRPLSVMMEFEPAKLEALGTDPATLLADLAKLGFRTRVLDAEQARVCVLHSEEIFSTIREAGLVNLLLDA